MRTNRWGTGSNEDSLSDEKLFDLIRNEDSAAMEYIYRIFFPLVRAEMGFFIKDSEELKDLFQDGIIALWQNIKNGKYELRSSTKMSSYVIRIVKYRWIEKIKSGRSKYESKLPDNFDALNGEKNAEEMIIQMEDNSKLMNYFSSLGSKCQQILIEYYYKKSSLGEIADMLGMQVASVKNEKYRCMQKLRTIIKQ